jgi:N-acetylmuramoyl-L-alanine amidase
VFQTKRLLICLGLMIGLAGAARAADAPKVMSVNVEAVSGATLVEITSSEKLDARVFTLAEGKPRIVVDFPTVSWLLDGVKSDRGDRAGAGAVVKYRYAQNSPTRSRLVFDLASPVSMSTENSVEAGRGKLRIVLTGADVAAFSEGSGFPAVPAEAVVSTPAAPKSKKKTIVLDAGHGGKDPGALAVNGTQEKNVTLAAVKQLADALKATGRYNVVLTRSDDTFIKLDQRVEIARKAKADLFLSLHADAGENPDVRGASVYTLSEAGTLRAKNIMAVQDWELDVKNTKSREVSDILVDLAQRDTKNQSAVFARKVVPRLQAAGASVLANSHRNAGFFVLLAPDVPAVLLEMGFLTNPNDAAELTNAKYRGNLMNGLALAIDDYFSPPVVMQSASR